MPLALIVLLIPVPAFAAIGSLKDIVGIMLGLLLGVTYLLGALILLAFFYGVARYIWGAGGGGKRADDKTYLFWSTIAVFVMVSVWGIIAIIRNTFL